MNLNIRQSSQVEALEQRVKDLETQLERAQTEVRRLSQAKSLTASNPQSRKKRSPTTAAGGKQDNALLTEPRILYDPSYLEAVMQYLPSGVVLVEAPSGRFIKMNEKGAELLERNPDELPESLDGYISFQGFREDGSPYLLEDWPLVRSLQKGEVVWNEDIRVVYPDGSERNVRASSTPVYNSLGVMTGGLLVMNDITHQQQALRALGESESRFRIAAENSLDGFAILTAVREKGTKGKPGKIIDFRYEYVNEKGCELNQRSREEQIGHTLLELLPAHQETGIFDEYVELVETGKPVIKESLYYEDRFGDGTRLRRAYDMQAVKLGDGFALTWRDVTERKLLEDRLAYQSAVLENLHEAVVATDLDLRVTSWNRGAETLYGWTEQEAIGQPVSSLMGIRTSANECKEIIAILKEGGIFSAQVEQRSRQRKPLFLEANALPIHDVHGEVSGYVATIRDITSQLEDQQRLQESEERFRYLADAMPQLVWSAGADGIIDYYNQRFQEFTQPKQKQELQLEWLPIVHAEDQALSLEAWTKAIQSGEPFEHEHRLQVANGEYHWFLSRGVPLKDEHGQVTRWFGTSTDIHELKEVEEEMRRHSERLALLSDTAGELLRSSEPEDLLDRLFYHLAELIDLDVCVHYLAASDESHLELASQLGVPSDKMPGIQHIELGQGVCGTVALTRQPLLVEDVPQHPDSPMLQIAREFGLSAFFCFPLIVHNRLLGTLGFGSRKRAHLDQNSIDLLRGASDLFATALDRRKSELELKDYAQKLESSNQELQNFAFVASHDLKEPLRKIDAFANALDRSADQMDEDQKEYLHRIHKAAQRMQSMVDDLLRLSRITTRPQPFEKVNLSQVVAEVLSDLEVSIQRSGGRVEVSELPVIDADPLQMRQLFQNLINNALKFHEPGKSPFVLVGYDSRKQDPNPGKPGARQVEIRISDNGIGFPPGEVERIFQPFQRLVGRSQYEGSGIGLAICRKIVERHKGSMTAHSQPGEGSTFIVRLPVSQG